MTVTTGATVPTWEVVRVLADRAECVIGVDTHRDQHAVVVVDATSGRVVDQLVVAASRAGYAQAVAFADQHAGGRLWAVEGTGSYAAGLTRYLSGRGERVWEVERPHRRGRDGRMKDDWLDAGRAAQQVLSGGGSTPRQGTEADALRLLVRTREGAVTARAEAMNELRAAIVTAPDELRERLSGLARPQLLVPAGDYGPDQVTPSRPSS